MGPGGNAEKQNGGAEGGKTNNKRRKPKNEQTRTSPKNAPPSSPNGSVDSAGEKATSSAKHQQTNTNKGRPSMSYPSQQQMPRKGSASAKPKAHSVITPRRFQRLSSHQLAS